MFVYCGNSCHVGERLWSLHGCFAGVAGPAAGKLRARWGGWASQPKNSGFLWVAGQRQVLGSIASDTPKKQPTTNPMHYLVILCSAGKGAPWGMVLVADPVNPS